MTATLTTLIALNFTDGAIPQGSLLFDLMATYSAPRKAAKVVCPKAPYSRSPKPLVATPAAPLRSSTLTLKKKTAGIKGGLIADANGDLFGTAGDLFEIVKPTGGYASTPATLATLNSGAGPAGNRSPMTWRPFWGSGGG